MQQNGRRPDRDDQDGWLLWSASFVLVVFWILILLAMVKIVLAP